MSDQSASTNPNDATLVDARCLVAAATETAADSDEDFFAFLSTEPMLAQVLKRDLLQVCGKLALAGAGPKVVHGVAGDIHRLVGLGVRAVRLGYRGLLADLMPSDPTEPPPAAPEPPPEELLPF